MQRNLLTVVVIVFWAGLYIYVPVLSPYAAELGADLALVGLVVGSYGVTQLLLRIPTGLLTDHVGTRKPFVTAGFTIASLSAIAMALAPSASWLVIGRGLSGVSATMWVSLSVLLASSFPPDRAVAAMGLAGFANNIGQIIGTLSGGWITQAWGWQAPFWVAAAVSAAGLLLLLPVKEKREVSTGRITMAVLSEVLFDRKLLVVSGLAALLQYTVWVTIFGFTPLYAASLGASPAILGWLTVTGLAAQALTALATSAASDRFGPTRTLTAGFVVTAVTTAAIPLTGALPALFAVQALGGVGRGLTSPLLMGLSIQAVPGPRRAIAMGIYQSIYALGMAVGPVIAGALGRSLGVRGLFFSTAAVAIAALIGVWAAAPLLAAPTNLSLGGPGSDQRRIGSK